MKEIVYIDIDNYKIGNNRKLNRNYESFLVLYS